MIVCVKEGEWVCERERRVFVLVCFCGVFSMMDVVVVLYCDDAAIFSIKVPQNPKPFALSPRF